MLNEPLPQSKSISTVKSLKVFEAFSHPILNAINRLLIHYLVGNAPERVVDLFDFVTEAFTEKNVRADFLRILYQPSSVLSPYRVISLQSAASLAHLFNSFMTFCVKQRDYKNALRLHKTSSVLIVNSPDHRFPLYGYLYTHNIYTKVGFWTDLLFDYCSNQTESDPSYSMQYDCLHDMNYLSKRVDSFAQLWITAGKSAGNLAIACGKGREESVYLLDVKITSSLAISGDYDKQGEEMTNVHVDGVKTNKGDISTFSTSSQMISRALIYLSDLMIDLRISDEYANQIISAIIRLINR